MKIETKKDISDILKMPEAEFYRDVAPLAEQIRMDTFNGLLCVTAMLGYTNICKNQCLYCGMRAGNSTLKRYRISPDDVISACLKAADNGYKRIFLISGDDPKYGFDNLLKIISDLKKREMYISLACGELEKGQYSELKAAGTDEYVLKFEMSDPENFNRLNPSTDFYRRMKSIETIKNLGMKLASGNIVDWPGQTEKELADDIYLMKQLEISWAPIIPYMPVPNTPLAQNAKPGNLFKLYQEIAILRIMMPEVNITAQQPGKDLSKGLSDPASCHAAVKVGANMLFFDLLPSESFRVIDNRSITGPEHIFKIAHLCDCKLNMKN